jgi:NADH dehydrogenase
MIHIRKTNKKRIVIIGAGFAGLKLARKLMKTQYEIILIDKYNFHQFQPLFYQVASAGLDPGSISFPLRKIFQHSKNVSIRLCEAKEIDTQNNTVLTTIGKIDYDFLVLAQGTDTNYFGMNSIYEKALSMKSTPEALQIRNTLLNNLERALVTDDPEERGALMNIAIVGGGATGVELAGALSEMRKFVLPHDYPELDFKTMNIYLLEAGANILSSMSKHAQSKALQYLKKLGIEVMLDTAVKDYDGQFVYINDQKISSRNFIWAAGVITNKIFGINETCQTKNNRIRTDRYNLVEGYDSIFVIGDAAYMTEPNYPKGHPQVAQVAIQQANNLGNNLKRKILNKEFKEFKYKDLGSMATVGRNLAVVDLKHFKISGLFAWLFWLFVHLMAIVGVKNKLFIFINWVVNYFTLDQSLRLIINTPSKSKIK